MNYYSECWGTFDEDGEMFIAGEWVDVKKEVDAIDQVQIKPKYTTYELFDQYYDYLTLHKIFGDKEYKDEMDDILKQIKLI